MTLQTPLILQIFSLLEIVICVSTLYLSLNYILQIIKKIRKH
jgi:hypothetical protein